MKYIPIERKNGTVYMLGIPDTATDRPMPMSHEIILELLEKIEKLQNTPQDSDYDALVMELERCHNEIKRLEREREEAIEILQAWADDESPWTETWDFLAEIKLNGRNK